ncbi:MAG: hypothetical protein AAB069_01805, partial [Planctomycetota bacterium]
RFIPKNNHFLVRIAKVGLKGFIKALKIKKTTKETHKKKPYSVFDKIAESATDVGIEDWARNHDHYLYGTDKR